MSARPGLSVVIPVYNAAGTIAPLVLALLDAFKTRGFLQVVLVDDCSADDSPRVCAELARRFPENVAALRLWLNCGEHRAALEGLRRASGDYAVLMDDDGQHDPADAVRLYEAARLGGFDLVYSRYGAKRHAWWRNLASRINGFAAAVLFGKPAGLYLSSFKCMSRRLVRAVVRYRGPFPYVDGLALRRTRNIGVVDVAHRPRLSGRSGYTAGKLLALWADVLLLGMLGERAGELDAVA